MKLSEMSVYNDTHCSLDGQNSRLSVSSSKCKRGLYQSKREKAYLTFPHAVEIRAFYSFPGKEKFRDTSQNKFIKTANCRQISSSNRKQLGLPESQVTSILMDHFSSATLRSMLQDWF